MAIRGPRPLHETTAVQAVPLSELPPPVEGDRHLLSGDGDVLDLRVSDLTFANMKTLTTAAEQVADPNHRAVMRAAARIIGYHDNGDINLVRDPDLATLVDAGFGYLSNYS